MLCILLKRHPRTLKFASRYLGGDSNFKIEALNQSINQFNNFVIWRLSSWWYFVVSMYILWCLWGTIWSIHPGTKPYSLFWMVDRNCMMCLINTNLKLIKSYLNLLFKLSWVIFQVSCLSYGMSRCPGGLDYLLTTHTQFFLHCRFYDIFNEINLNFI